MYIQAFLKMPSDTDILARGQDGNLLLDAGVVAELSALFPKWANTSCPDGGSMMPGTRVVTGMKVVQAFIEMAEEDPKAMIEGMLLINEDAIPDWELLGMYSVRTHSVLDENDEQVVDENGDPVPNEIIVYKEMDPAFDEFLADVYSGDPPVPSRPVRPVQLASCSKTPVVLT